MSIPDFINVIIGLLYVVFFIYLIRNKKEVPINILGVKLMVSVLYFYVIAYDVFHDHELNKNLTYEIMVLRVLVVAAMYMITKRYVKINRELTKMSKNVKTLLKPRKNDTT